jgi:hypothetical protein
MPKDVKTTQSGSPFDSEECPTYGRMLKTKNTGGAFLDGCYMNTTGTLPGRVP